MNERRDERKVQSVLQDWVMELPLRYQGVLLSAMRGCDDSPKEWTSSGEVADTAARRLTAWLRWACLNPADPREVDVPGAFMQSRLPRPFKPSGLGHFPLHWFAHVMHAFQVVAVCHPSAEVSADALGVYDTMVHSLHLNPETPEAMRERLTEDRFVTGTVVS